MPWLVWCFLRCPLPHEGQSTVLSSRSVLMKPHSGQPVQPMNIPQRERFTATGLPQSGQLVPGRIFTMLTLSCAVLM